MTKANTRVAGHALPNEGRVRDAYGYWTNEGTAVCSCGARSDSLSSTNARKRWHAEHKQQIAAEGK